MTAFVDKSTVEALTIRMRSFLTKQESESFEKRLGPVLEDCEKTLTEYSKE